jgi:transposase
MILHLSIPKYHCRNCNRYFRHQVLGVRPRLRATESYRPEVFEDHDGGVSRSKHRLNKLILIKNLMPKHGKKFMGRLLKLIGQLDQSPARTLANTLTSWLEPIVRMWRTSKSNGVTEGFHTKMEMMSRRAYGFRNFENYRLRVLAHCGWNGVFCRV